MLTVAVEVPHRHTPFVAVPPIAPVLTREQDEEAVGVTDGVAVGVVEGVTDEVGVGVAPVDGVTDGEAVAV